MSGPRTKWEDLANLGWYKQQAYDRFNARRGGTMQGLGDIALNDWFSYNVLVGPPRIAGNNADTIESSTIVWMYDNSQNMQEFQASWTETWTNSSRASLSISTHAGISLNQSISIPGVGGSEFSITISTDSTKEETRETSHQLSTSWGITVMAGEIVSIERVRMDYGLAPNSLMATKGKLYDGHYYWGFNINSTLNSPRGTMSLLGRSTQENYTFRIVRTTPDGHRRTEPLPPPEGKSTRARMSKECNAEFPLMVPGIEKQ
ncbi:TEER-decreasing protein [Mycena galericulata]|nr:TEER-decreasing protein [Mycena galericulata]